MGSLKTFAPAKVKQGVAHPTRGFPASLLINVGVVPLCYMPAWRHRKEFKALLVIVSTAGRVVALNGLE